MHLYNDPANGQPSSIGPQLQDFYFQKSALVDAVKKQYFSKLADVTAMPKHYGKRIKRYVLIPLLDDRNINDQGIDALGQVISNGNLYGSSRDIGTIPGKLPVVSETGGRVNRVGFTRLQIEGTFAKYGYFTEWSQESLDFDTTEDLYGEINKQMVNAANEINEAMIQIDLINNAGTLRYAGGATSLDTIDATAEISYNDFLQLGIELDNNRSPKETKMVTGSRMVDTKVIGSGRVMFVGPELVPTLYRLQDFFSQPAFVPIEKYGAAVTPMEGEIGSVAGFRIIQIQDMFRWEGAGDSAAGNSTHHQTNGKFDVIPLLTVGSESFTTIGFQTDGKSVKFRIIVKQPGEATAGYHDPYGESGFMSIKWFYGFMVLRPERIGLMMTSARL